MGALFVVPMFVAVTNFLNEYFTIILYTLPIVVGLFIGSVVIQRRGQNRLSLALTITAWLGLTAIIMYPVILFMMALYILK